MSFAPYFRIKAELYGMLFDNATNAVDRAWYAGLIRSYNLLAASEDRHYYSGLKAVPAETTQTVCAQPDQAELESDIAVVLQSEIKRSAA